MKPAARVLMFNSNPFSQGPATKSQHLLQIPSFAASYGLYMHQLSLSSAKSWDLSLAPRIISILSFPVHSLLSTGALPTLQLGCNLFGIVVGLGI